MRTSASRLIDQRIRDLGDGAGRRWPACGRWILEADPEIDAGAFKALVKAAVAQNGPPAKKR